MTPRPHPDETTNPSPSRPPTPSPETTGPSSSTSPRGEEDSSASSARASSAASEFAADPGPPFDPDNAPAPPDVDVDDRFGLVEEPRWEEHTIREGLTLQGELLHSLVEWRLQLEDTDVWLHTERDLRAIAPPLTRILNRYDVTRAAAAAGDEALLAAGLLRYGSRNVVRTRRAMAARRAQGEQPITGVPAEPGTGPEHDAEWQRVHNDPLGGAPPSIRPKGR